MSVRTRLLALVGVLMALWIVSTVLAAGSLNSARSRVGQTASAAAALQVAHSGYEGWLGEVSGSQRYAALVALGNPTAAANAFSSAQAGHATAVGALTRLERLAPSSRLALVGRVLAALSGYDHYMFAMHTDALAGSSTAALHAITVSATSASASTQSAFGSLTRSLSALATAPASQDSLFVTILPQLLLVLIGLAAAFLGANLVLRSIIRPLAQLVASAERVILGEVSALERGLDALAAGDLTQAWSADAEAIQIDGRDEITAVTRAVERVRASIAHSLGAYNHMRVQLRGVIGEVTKSALVVSSSSQQIASNTAGTGTAIGEISHAITDVAKGAERQSTMIEAACSSVATVAAAAADSARNAEETAEVAVRALEAAQRGTEAAAAATVAMRSVHSSTTRVSDAMAQLAARSEEIGVIVETITGIANQTNLLALNAAIEAARAGEQGRGFAVVSDEVRKLAEESQRSASEIAMRIEQIQTATSEVVEIARQGAASTDEGVAVVEETRAVFSHIDEMVQDMSARVARIVFAAQQAAHESEQMQGQIAEVAAVAQQSSASSEEVSASIEQTSESARQIAASAHGLADTSHALEELIGRFEVAGELRLSAEAKPANGSNGHSSTEDDERASRRARRASSSV
ncbi:MAG: methyl-accepting chemotaxis protein [Solirubrobacteraceae bacterium]